MARRISVGHNDRWIVSSGRVHAGESTANELVFHLLGYWANWRLIDICPWACFLADFWKQSQNYRLLPSLTLILIKHWVASEKGFESIMSEKGGRLKNWRLMDLREKEIISAVGGTFSQIRVSHKLAKMSLSKMYYRSSMFGWFARFIDRLKCLRF